MRLNARFATLLAFCVVASFARADVKLQPLFSNHMVLQAERECPVWGTADAGEEVTVEFAGQSVKATAGADGKWMVKLQPMKVNSTGQKLTVKGKNTITLDDVLIGEVWLCSGQSNMEWSVSQSDRPKEEIAAANHPRIRHIKMNHRPSSQPATDVPSDGWKVCSPQTAGNFTATGYYFALEIMKALDVPVGLIGSNWGGTRIEPWTPPEGFKQVTALKDIADKLDTFPTKSQQKDKKDPTKVTEVINHQSPLALYNGMIHPLLPYSFRGALWYQGESNLQDGMLYFEKMKALITGWRTIWNQPDMPFYFVQIAPYKYGNTPNWKLAALWESQVAALTIPNTGMAGTMDIGNLKDIHPKNKQDVGKRLALCALSKTYGKAVPAISGPLYKSFEVSGNKIKISFDHAANGLISRDGKPLTDFIIAGEDQKFVAAKAEIEGNTVVVSAESVAKPAAVRFGWSQLAEPNLSNKEGLPAVCFRTDKWSPDLSADAPAAPAAPVAPAK
ncbi:MAG TPA: sialate O-acetylesterase [Planctomycetota bacterium]|nr:sialate O-acetylesterase [Planctomycetota bacterium]